MNAFYELLEKSEVNKEFLKELYNEHYICSKEVDHLIVFYHKFYNNYIKPDTIQSSVRSVIYNTLTKKVVSDCGTNPIYNNEASVLINDKDLTKLNFLNYYDGTVMSLFFDTDKWYLTTRRCLDSNQSYYQSQHSHRELFNKVLEETEYKTFDDFTKSLEKDKSYYFVLIHHENQQIIDYTAEYGKNYKKLCLFSVKDSEQKIVDLYSTKFDFVDEKTIFVAKKIENGDKLFVKKSASKFDYKTNFVCYFENKLLIFNTISYQLARITKYDDHPTVSGLIFAYQHDILADYHKLMSSDKTITTADGRFTTSNILQVLFKTSSTYLFLMFRELWSITTGKPMAGVLRAKALVEVDPKIKSSLEREADVIEYIYKKLPTSYKELFYAIRGIYFSKKSKLLTAIKKSDTYLNVHDIYNYLKNMETKKFIKYIKETRNIFDEPVFIPLLQNVHMNAEKIKLYNMDDFNKYRYFIRYVDLQTTEYVEELEELTL